MKKTTTILIILIILLFLAVISWLFLSQKAQPEELEPLLDKSEQDQEEDVLHFESLEEQFFDMIQSPSEKILELNPFQKVKTNPFE